MVGALAVRLVVWMLLVASILMEATAERNTESEEDEMLKFEIDDELVMFSLDACISPH